MKIYLDLQKQAITKTTDEKTYEGDFYSNVFEVLFYNYTDSNWFPTMSQLAPNGRKAGEFTADALNVGESHEVTEDGVTYLKFDFTMGASWVLMKGRSEFYIWFNRLGGAIVQKKCVGVVNVMIDQSTTDYFIADPTFNPNVKVYIDACIAELGDGSPKYFDTASNIANCTEDKGLAVATDTGHLYYWDETKNSTTKYTDSGLVYNDLSAYYTITQMDALLAQKVNKADVADNLTTNDSDKVLSAKQGYILKGMLDTMQAELDSVEALENLNNIVGSYSELESLITVGEPTDYQLNAKVQVLNDSTHDNNSTLYNLDSLDIVDGLVQNYIWRFVGYYDGYNKEQIDEIINDFEQSVTDNFNELSGQLEVALTEQTETIEQLGQLQPKGVDIESNILGKLTADGIWIGSDTGHWYYWNGTQYVDGGVYQATQIGDGSIDAGKLNDNLKYVLLEKDNNVTRTSSNNNAALNISGVVTPVSPSYRTNVYDISNFEIIYVVATTLYPNSNYCDYCFTDEDDDIISYYQNGTQGVSYSLDTFINVPSNAKYFKLSIVNSTFGNEQVLSVAKISQKLNKDIYDKLINDSFTTVNLYDKYTTIDGYILNGDGTLSENSSRLVTDFIEVDYTKPLYAIGGSSISTTCFYNENKQRIYGYQPNFNVQTPTLIDMSSYSNCKYIRITIELIYKDSFILSKTPTNYPYGNKCIKFENIENSSNILLNHWMGKNGDSLGDSITAQGYYQKAVSSILNLDMYYNHGIGGTKITGNDDNSMHKDIRINALNENADFITIMGGTNDGDVSIGEISLSNINTDTYVGALNTIISKIYYKYAHTSISNGVDYSGITQTTNAKNIKIFIMTPTFTGTDSTGRVIKQSNAIRELCKLWGIPVIDISGKSGMNFGTINYCFNGTDLVHPIEQCHYDMIAPVIVNELLDNPIVNYDNVKISKQMQ